MTPGDILRMAREAGGHELFRIDGAQDSGIGLTGNDSILRFAALVAAAEREACAKVCDEQAESHEDMSNTQAIKGCDECAAAIRARSQP